MTTSHSRSSVNWSPLRLAFLLIPLALAWFALSPTARAVDPAPDGGYPGGNTAEGDDALFSLDTSQGIDNTALGFNALYSTTTGTSNTATGFEALYNNIDGGFNTANGYQALYSNTTGMQNTATGFEALSFNTTGMFNTGLGYQALVNNRIGTQNTAVGYEASADSTTGNYNTAIGFRALNTNMTGNNNIGVGNNAGYNLTTGSDNIEIGNFGIAGESRTIRVGTRQTQRATFIAGITGATVPTGVAVIVDGLGHLGTTTSSARFKEAIKPMDKASEAILALKPVTFRYKHELDPAGIPQFGLVAEQVEKVDPDLVARDDQGQPYTVRYEAVNAMLLNEFLKEHRKVQEQGRKAEEQEATITQLKCTSTSQEATISQLKKGMEVLAAQLQEQAAQIQKVSAQLELSKSTPQIAGNN